VSKGAWVDGVIKTPTGDKLKIHGALAGFVIVLNFCLVSIFALTHNVLILIESHIYLDFVVKNMEIYILAVFLCLLLFSVNAFFLREYRSYLNLAHDSLNGR